MAVREVRDETSEEDYLDCAGRNRTFRLSPYANDLWLQAVEVRKGGEHGIRFCLPARDGVLPWGELRQHIRARLAQRDVVRTRDGKLQMLNQLVRGQITSTDAQTGEGPSVLVDDLELSWEELGQLLNSYEGWHFRLELQDAGEDS
jgi:hypothetical protein